MDRMRNHQDQFPEFVGVTYRESCSKWRVTCAGHDDRYCDTYLEAVMTRVIMNCHSGIEHNYVHHQNRGRKRKAFDPTTCKE